MEENANTPNPETSDASSLKPQSAGQETQTALKPQLPLEEDNPARTSKWESFWKRTRLTWFLFGELLTLLWSLALWDSYSPKITVTPGGSLNAKSPFGTYFIMQNQGALSISDIRYRTQLEPVPLPGTTNAPHVVSTEQNVSVIPQMGSLESYAFTISYAAVQINRGPPPAITNQIHGTIPPFQITALLLKFEVSYQPRWYFKREQTFHFTGLIDVDGNWQWLPSAHQSIRDQIIDTNLIPKSPVIPTPSESIKRSTSSQAGSSKITLTNGSPRAHKN
jgi:hypothetical protein